ncbi:hypothetical protein [Bradyrhizobium sp. DASA03120]|uniref:hypothetical protein n=1 Tax=Bradyrhizobium sp. SMVTL-02 TaxID=3395917 RepID=UPI003F72572D
MSHLETDEPLSEATNRKVRQGPSLLILFHIFVCCLSLVFVSDWYSDFHIFFDEQNVYQASLGIALLSLTSIFFTVAEFSFGYFVCFYLYTMVIGYVWLSFFTKFDYDVSLARFSATASLLALVVPALLIGSPVPQICAIPDNIFRKLPTAILILSAATIVFGATYGFRIVALADIYKFQSEIAYPSWMNYLIGVTSTVLLPFSFACCFLRREKVRATFCLLLSVLFYPITLNKLTLFTPIWLLLMAASVKFFSERTAAILSLLIPVSAGIILMLLFGASMIPFFGTVNFRMLAIPSSAMDIYNDFFAQHSLTYFCQISILKFSDCAYQSQLGVVMADRYHLGNINASLLATEGIASVGLQFAPVTAFICGLVISFGNRVSAGLPPSFILISSSILPQVFLNVPLSTILLTYGAALLFVLWYVTPRGYFEPETAR